METTFTLPAEVAQKVDSEAKRQNIPADKFLLDLIETALESQKRASLVGLFDDPEMISGEDLKAFLRQNWENDLDRDR